MRTLQAAIDDVAASEVPVLITGERGAGKRALAREIHRRSSRHRGGFHEVKCGTVGPELLAHALRALAGPEHGASTVYFQDIDALSREGQQRLLETLARPNGHSNHRAVRLVCSTAQNLEQACAAGAFREDLHYLLSGVCLRFPPLRHRKEDIPPLLDEFLSFYAALFVREKPALGAELLQFCAKYAWPGNVRELDEAARMVVAIGDEHIAVSVLRSVGQGRAAAPNGHGHANAESYSLKDAGRAASRRAERELILKVLSRTRWNRKRAAEELKISYKALLYKLKSIGLDEDVLGPEEYTS